MRNTLLPASLTMLVLLSSCAAQQTSRAITGYIRDGHEPLSHVEVTSDEQASPTETDSQGYFRLELKSSVADGALIWIHLRKSGYTSVDGQENYSGPAQKPFSFTLEKAMSNRGIPAVVINAFYDANGRLLPGNEHVLKSGPVLTDGKVPVMQSGATLVTTIVRTGAGATPAAVSQLQLRVSYRPGSISKYQYDSGPSNVSARAIVESLDYIVQLDGDATFVARAPLKLGEPPVAVSSEDLLGAGQALSLTRDDVPQTLKFHLGALKNGLYEIELVAVWSVGGVNKESHSQKILFYKDE
jgi:hypothetical protein